MSSEEPKKPTDGYVREVDATKERVLSSVLEETNVLNEQRKKRKELLRAMEQHDEGKKSGYLAFFCSESVGAWIDSDDIPAFAEALASLGDLDQLTLIINGPGGDGTVAEKMIELCREYCKGGHFRVAIPNRAKSAATIIALGADEIIMGYCSELGPIDAQIPVIVGNVPEYISAQSFIDARDSLESRFNEAVKKNADPRAILQQIASLDIAFIEHCDKLMEFSKDVARKNLESHMFATVPAPERKARIEKVVKGLSSTQVFKVHGRMIDGNMAKTELKLNVRLLGRADPLWKELWQYYVRADVAMARGLAKLIETKEEALFRAVRVA
jgi:ATP-dependent protease ClpP protease subunit